MLHVFHSFQSFVFSAHEWSFVWVKNTWVVTLSYIVSNSFRRDLWNAAQVSFFADGPLSGLCVWVSLRTCDTGSFCRETWAGWQGKRCFLSPDWAGTWWFPPWQMDLLSSFSQRALLSLKVSSGSNPLFKSSPVILIFSFLYLGHSVRASPTHPPPRWTTASLQNRFFLPLPFRLFFF